ncbi:MAG: hypothetical protein UY17_C0032G0007 [Candidatus Beckwithbacteria bacterium GW2011_GWC2_47_9]|uniref:Uncharacterized protein n=1 Tax=Candidatus Beckwithbacteria bacterium GW2011_GWC2_47_9 TaxID=1618373 RepID=A0A0G1TYX3_9BACT|nr:MAG: hypothetical protein UY17_C0032G0007 [Candidatus Beckwithbacteria bacterium GW2011_GWC2_47_9]
MSLRERVIFKSFQQDLSTAITYENQMKYKVTGEKKWVVRKGMPWPIVCCEGTYPYIVMPDGEVRFPEKPWPISKMRHPELCNGKEVIGAGIFEMRDKKIVSISNESGHYGPKSDSLYYVKLAFKYWSAPLAENLKSDGRWELFGNR